MPTYPLSEDAVITACATIGGSYVPINGLDTFSRQDQRQVTKKPIFQADPLAFTGALDVSGSYSGIYSADDAGQILVRAAIKDNTTLYIKLLPNGTDGKQSPVTVTQKQDGGNAADNVPTFSFNWQLNGTEVDVGTGEL